MVGVVFEHRGTIDKFVGDMVMALFGAPLDDPAHADHALQAALAMLEGVGGPERRVGGARPADARHRHRHQHRGDGRRQRGLRVDESYTVIGDAVNLGSRLESLNKATGRRIIISEHTRARLKGSMIFARSARSW